MVAENSTDSKKPFYYKKSENLELHAIDFENGIFVAISEISKLRLGTIALSLPLDSNLERKKEIRQPSNEFLRRGITTTIIIGSRNEIITKALAEKMTSRTGKLLYLSLNIRENDNELYSEALELSNTFVKENYQEKSH